MNAPQGAEPHGPSGQPSDESWHFLLFTAGDTPSAQRTRGRLQALVDRLLGGGATIEVVDLSQDPARAQRENILAIPTVVRIRPEPRRLVIGDLSDVELACRGLGLPAP